MRDGFQTVGSVSAFHLKHPENCSGYLLASAATSTFYTCNHSLGLYLPYKLHHRKSHRSRLMNVIVGFHATEIDANNA